MNFLDLAVSGRSTYIQEVTLNNDEGMLTVSMFDLTCVSTSIELSVDGFSFFF